MHTVAQQKVDALPLLAVGLMVLGCMAVGIAEPDWLPWVTAVTVLAGVLLYWSVRWDVTIWAWLWVLSYGLLDWPEWRIELVGFFNLTVPRLIFLTVMVGFFVYYLVHTRQLRFDRGLLWAMLALVLYIGISTHVTGWTARTELVRSAPYYRFIGSILLPFVMFYLLYNATWQERHIRRGLLLVTLFGWYALYIGYLQFAAINGWEGARQLIWPAYINDPEFGIHFDRGRGPFAAASPQAILMVLLFYVDLYLIRRVRGPYRALLIVQAVLVPPAIFFTLLRSAYLGFLVCGIIWILYASGRRFRWMKLALLLLVVAIGVYVLWPRLTSKDRAAGGVAQVDPIRSRIVLVAQTWELFKEAPLTGVGFGKFVDAQMDMQRDPSSLVGATYGVLVQHNLFLNMLAETGLFGVILTLAVFVLLFGQSRRLWRKLPPHAQGDLSRDFVVLFWVVMANYLSDAMFRDPLWDVFSNGMLWCFAGLTVAYNRLLEPGRLELPIVPSLETA